MTLTYSTLLAQISREIPRCIEKERPASDRHNLGNKHMELRSSNNYCLCKCVKVNRKLTNNMLFCSWEIVSRHHRWENLVIYIDTSQKSCGYTTQLVIIMCGIRFIQILQKTLVHDLKVDEIDYSQIHIHIIMMYLHNLMLFAMFLI